MKSYILPSVLVLFSCITVFSCKSKQQSVPLSGAYAQAGSDKAVVRERVPVVQQIDDAPPFAEVPVARAENRETRVMERVEVAEKVEIAEIAPPVVPAEPEKVRDEKFTLDVEEKNVAVIQLRYHVVVGSFKNRDNAKSLQQTLNNEGNQAVIVVNEQEMYRVLIASFNEYMDARQKINQISNRFPDAWVLVQKD